MEPNLVEKRISLRAHEYAGAYCADPRRDNSGLPHWARIGHGEWTFTPDGAWTGGAFVGELWLAAIAEAERSPNADGNSALRRMLRRSLQWTVF